MKKVTIQISQKTKNQLSKLKENRKETYDEVLTKLISLVPKGDDEGTYKDTFRAGLLSGLSDVAEGRTVKLEENEIRDWLSHSKSSRKK